jgi:hypothetical protein
MVFMNRITRTFLIVLNIVYPVVVFAQTTISGKVTDKKNPLQGVSISLKNTYDGATTDSLGRFSFKTFEKGEFILSASSVGYKIYEQKIKVEGGKLTIDIALKEDITELKAVVITAGTFEASDKKKTTVLNPIDIVTTASANGDVTGALKTLPGAQQVGESEGLFVRGGTAGETKTYIDGSLVNDFFYSSVPNIAQRGRFSPFIFKGTIFSTGGYSALYGQALSSALILESIDLPDRTSANLGVSVIGANAGYQKLAKNKQSSWGFSYGYTDLTLAFKLFNVKPDYFIIPVYHTGDANFRIKTSKTGMLKYYGYFSANHLGLRNPSLDSSGYQDVFRLKNINVYHNLSYKESLSTKWKLIAGVSYTNNKDEIKNNVQNGNNDEVILTGLEFKNFGLDLKSNYFNGKFIIERKLKGLSALRFGSEYNYSNDHSTYTLYNGQMYENSVKENLISVFGEGDVYITNNIAAKIGTRFEYSSLLDKINIAPRISLAYKLGKESQASLAYGIFYQDPERRYLPAINSLNFSKATHYIIQYQRVTGLITFRMEAFYKRYNDLIKTLNSNGRDLAANNNGYGDAKGFEIFWRDKKTIKDLDYWISYSYLDTKRDFLNFPFAIQPNFAATHTASVVVKKFVTKWKTGFNGSYNYASGRPYYNIGYDGSQYKFTDKGTTPDYHNVSFSLNYIPSIGQQNPKAFVVYVVSVSNIFGIKQTYGYQYSYNGLRKEPIIPTTRFFIYIGAFFSFGIDRTRDAINNNLSLKI